VTPAHQQGVLDTSTVVLLPRLSNADQLPREPVITAITLAELTVGPLVTDDETERAARQAHVQQAEADFEPLPFDAAAAQAFGQVASDLRAAGRTTKARAYDALIAAIAVAHQLPIYTVNPRDFEHISDLELVPIPHPDVASESEPIE
jgi:tRNA(fMet)-specific endonuclease VapC